VSVSVSLERLREEVARHGDVAYLLTVGGDGRPHTVQLAVAWSDDADELVVMPGKGTLANAAARPLVSLLWPPTEPGGYSLIVDGEATGTGDGIDRLAVTPTKAVLHRPARSSDADIVAHGYDCVAVLKQA
jgi:hypothetical protein